MKLCIAIVCSVLGVTGCKSNKSEPATSNEPPSPTVPARTVEPAGSAAAPGSAAEPTAPDPHAGHQGSGASAPVNGPDCATDFDHGKFADKHQACVECEKHRGMGSMEAECKNAIAKPWK